MVLVELGIPVDLRESSHQRTPLHCAAGGGHVGACMMLVRELGADVNARDDWQRCPIHWAALYDAKGNGGVRCGSLAGRSPAADLCRVLVSRTTYICS